MKRPFMLLAIAAAAGVARADFQEGFENFTATGWTFANQSNPAFGPVSWHLSSLYANSGLRSLFADYSTGEGLSTLSDWAELPVQMFNNGDTFTFWTISPFNDPSSPIYPDRLQVRMSTNGASSNTGTSEFDVGDFTTLLLDINPTYAPDGYPWNWTQYTITISGLSGPTSGRLAFRYFVENGGPSGSNSNAVFIDDLAYTSASTSCYANCDNSSTNPILNANDFQCFLNKFAAGDTTANCDGSTAPPILNANDFQCFLNAYAAGCS